MSPIKFVVVGFGNIGKRHCEEIVRHPDAKLVAICDVDETKEKAAWKDFPVPFLATIAILSPSLIWKEIFLKSVLMP